MKRVAAIILALTFVCIGTGAIEYAHNIEHAKRDAEFLAYARATHTPIKRVPIHNEETCNTHAQLHMPALAMSCVPILVCIGLFIAFVIEMPRVEIDWRFPRSIDCRGPPTS